MKESSGSLKNNGTTAAAKKKKLVAAKILINPLGSCSHGPNARNAAMIAMTLPLVTLKTKTLPRRPADIKRPCSVATNNWLHPLIAEKRPYVQRNTIARKKLYEMNSVISEFWNP